MPLLTLWKSNPEVIVAFSVEQVVSAAGGGALKDGSECSRELRVYLSEVPLDRLASYIDHCLTHAFQKGGWVLQDLVNELGRRLDYVVQHGRYQGVSNAVGFDGLRTAPEGNGLLIEVKTTDAYRITLDTIIGYRRRLMQSDQASADTSVLIVTGRDDTGELEAQIRGSRHAWDIRLISVDALLKLVRIKENTEGRETAEKIRRLLVPVEFTRLDALIDVIFTTTKDVETAAQAEAEALGDGNESAQDEHTAPVGYVFTNSGDLQAKRDDLLAAISTKLGAHLVKHSRALFQNAQHTLRVAVTISKRYTRKHQAPYWYAYHPQWDDFLGDAATSYLMLGCMDRSEGFLLPLSTIRELLPKLYRTTRPDGRFYWHLKLVEQPSGTLALQLPGAADYDALERYRLLIEPRKARTG